MLQIPADIVRQLDGLVSQANAERIQRFAVGAVVLRAKAVLLLIRSEKEDMLPGYAEVPGGGVEENENVFTALSRELQEETGLRCLAVKAMLEPFHFTAGERPVCQCNFLVETDGGAVTLDPAEHVSFLWYELGKSIELDDLLITPEMRGLVEQASRLAVEH